MKRKINSVRFYKIRRLAKKGKTNTELANKFKVHQTTISRVLRANSWEGYGLVDKKEDLNFAAELPIREDFLYKFSDKTVTLNGAGGGGKPVVSPKAKHDLVGIIQESVEWILSTDTADNIAEAIINKYEK